MKSATALGLAICLATASAPEAPAAEPATEAIFVERLPGGGFVALGTEGNASWVCRMDDPAGKPEIIRLERIIAADAVTMADGGLILAGSRGSRGVIFRLDRTGAELWRHELDRPGIVGFTQLSVELDNFLAVAMELPFETEWAFLRWAAQIIREPSKLTELDAKAHSARFSQSGEMLSPPEEIAELPSGMFGRWAMLSDGTIILTDMGGVSDSARPSLWMLRQGVKTEIWRSGRDGTESMPGFIVERATGDAVYVELVSRDDGGEELRLHPIGFLDGLEAPVGLPIPAGISSLIIDFASDIGVDEMLIGGTAYDDRSGRVVGWIMKVEMDERNALESHILNWNEFGYAHDAAELADGSIMLAGTDMPGASLCGMRGALKLIRPE